MQIPLLFKRRLTSRRHSPQQLRNRGCRRPIAKRGIHPSWGNHAEELVYRTSRYYAYTEDFLRRISGVNRFSFGDFRAQFLDADQRAVMTHLLRRPAGRTTGRAVIALILRLNGQGKKIHKGFRSTTQSIPPKFRGRTPPSITRHNVHPLDPFLNLTERFGVPVRRQGRHLWVPFPTLKTLLDASHPSLRQALRDAIEQLHDGGFHLHGLHEGSQKSGDARH